MSSMKDIERKLRRIKALHDHDGGLEQCITCRGQWPCETMELADSALGIIYSRRRQRREHTNR